MPDSMVAMFVQYLMIFDLTGANVARFGKERIIG
mgnify:CR=1 FL=1